MFMEMDKRKAITKPIIQASVILGVFLAIEVVWVYLNVFPDNNMLLCADIVMRIVFGIVMLVILKGYSKRGVSKYPVNYAYFIIEIESIKKTALLYSKYTGATNHTPDRQGNFLSHSIVFEDYLENVNIPEIIKKLPFRESLSAEEELSFNPPSEIFEYEIDQFNSSVHESLLFLNSNKKYLVSIMICNICSY